MRPPVVFPGQRYGRLVVLREAGRQRDASGHSWRRYECICDCGETTVTTSNHLRQGRTRSCGCLQRENRAKAAKANVTHGHTVGKCSPTYLTWRSMLGRCYARGNASYDRYGGRGVEVCQRWRESFDAFLADMGERPDGKTLDRIDSDGHYEPGNCRWSTPAEQRANQRSAPQLRFAA